MLFPWLQKYEVHHFLAIGEFFGPKGVGCEGHSRELANGQVGRVLRVIENRDTDGFAFDYPHSVIP